MQKSNYRNFVIGLFSFTLTSLLSFSSHAEWDYHYLSYPAAFCNHDGLQPNMAAGLGNWTGSIKRAFCPVLKAWGEFQIRVPAVTKSGNVTCDLRVQNADGLSWSTYFPKQTRHFQNYDFVEWDHVPHNGLDGSGIAFECQVAGDGSRIQSYGAGQKWWDNA